MTTETSQPLLLNISQVARALGLSRGKVYQLIRQEHLPVIPFGRAKPTGCATRLLLGVNRLLNHCRSPHTPKGGGSWLSRLHVGTRCVMRFRDADGPN
jgi:excisionase family DNA binding protein